MLCAALFTAQSSLDAMPCVLLQDGRAVLSDQHLDPLSLEGQRQQRKDKAERMVSVLKGVLPSVHSHAQHHAYSGGGGCHSVSYDRASIGMWYGPVRVAVPCHFDGGLRPL